MNSPIISVVIPVYNASDTIERVLRRLIEIRGQLPIEIIAVDDCSTDDSLSRMEPLKTAVHIIRSAKNGGRGAARNLGAKAAKASIIIFLDSDCIPNDDSFFQRHIQFHQQHPCSVLTAFVYTPTKENDDAYIQYRFGQPVPNNPKLKTIDPGSFATGNASVKAVDFWKSGGFSETLHLYEDVDLALRMYHRGVHFYQDDSIIISHLDTFVSLPRDMKRNFLAYGSSVQYIIKIHPENINFIPLAIRFSRTGRNWWNRLRYEVLLPYLYYSIQNISNRFPRSLSYILFGYCIIGAAYNGYWDTQKDFFSRLKEY